MRPPEEIDGAKVLEWAWSGIRPFGKIRDTRGEADETEIFGLAICQYDNSATIYRFSCDSNWQTQQDADYGSVEEAKDLLPEQYQKVEVRWLKYK
mmetsp:Transcript_6947/g.10349  ORF Transcript_6947/g.10349 Transcript_6947/m.10349 type:complete len:95 (-) Transcript_6947:480-764(-)